MVNGGKELLELALAMPQASKGGLERLSLRFTTVVRLDTNYRQVPCVDELVIAMAWTESDVLTIPCGLCAAGETWSNALGFFCLH